MTTTPASQADFDKALDQFRIDGMSIDGDNSYKRDLMDCITGAMAFGFQNANPPPAGHWGKRFWDIGRAEGERAALAESELADAERYQHIRSDSENLKGKYWLPSFRSGQKGAVTNEDFDAAIDAAIATGERK